MCIRDRFQPGFGGFGYSSHPWLYLFPGGYGEQIITTRYQAHTHQPRTQTHTRSTTPSVCKLPQSLLLQSVVCVTSAAEDAPASLLSRSCRSVVLVLADMSPAISENLAPAVVFRKWFCNVCSDITHCQLGKHTTSPIRKGVTHTLLRKVALKTGIVPHLLH